ncbi:MAG: hypothetical protein WC516_09650 [Patescibacteria group bacterium]
MKDKTSAEWSYELWVTCPHCDNLFDLTRTPQWGEGLFECFEFFENEPKIKSQSPNGVRG